MLVPKPLSRRVITLNRLSVWIAFVLLSPCFLAGAWRYKHYHDNATVYPDPDGSGWLVCEYAGQRYYLHKGRVIEIKEAYHAD